MENFAEREFGEVCEMLFAVQAMKRGLIVSKPLHNVKYDFIVDNGTSLVRVQVKSTRSVTSRPNAKYKAYGVMVAHGFKSKKLYDKNHIDVFAIYVQPENAWFFIPVEDLNASKISVLLEGGSKYVQYLEAWKFLTKTNGHKETQPQKE
jgi:hypothetical protein